MSDQEAEQFDKSFRDVENEFHERPDHERPRYETTLITMPTELEFMRMSEENQAKEAAVAAKRAEQIKGWHEHYKREKWKGRMKKVMAVTAVAASLKSGGFIDMAADPFSDAGSVVESAVEVPITTIPDELDGIAFEDYPKKAKREIIAEENARVTRETEARDTLIDLFQKIDEDGVEGILGEVNAERTRHPELFASGETIEQANRAIDEAGTNEEALAGLGILMNTYGITVGFKDEVTFDDRQGQLKDVLHAYADVFSVLPKDFIAMAELKNVTVSNKSATLDDGFGEEAGVYSPDQARINVTVMSEAMSLGMRAEGTLDRDDYSYTSVVAHELGHALAEHIGISSNLSADETTYFADGIDAGPVFSQIGRGLMNRPKYISMYGRSAGGENTAELLSGLLSDRSNGLASPDEWRRFGSKANKDMIDVLARLEVARPGIAKILIANRAS